MSAATQPTPAPEAPDTSPTETAADLIEQAVATWQERLDEIERETQPLNDEADTLRKAIRRVTPTAEPSRGRSNGRGGQTRQTILAAITPDAKTAGQIAAETGIATGTVSSTLRVLTNDGLAVKAAKGYQANPS